MTNTDEWLIRIETKLDEVALRVANLEGQYSTTQTVIKWIVFPLIIILGAAFGVKMAFPNI